MSTDRYELGVRAVLASRVDPAAATSAEVPLPQELLVQAPPGHVLAERARCHSRRAARRHDEHDELREHGIKLG